MCGACSQPTCMQFFAHLTASLPCGAAVLKARGAPAHAASRPATTGRRVQNLIEFDDVKFQNAAKDDLKISDEEADKKLEKKLKETFKPLTKWWRKLVGDEGNLEAVRVSSRLSSTPCVVVTSKCVPLAPPVADEYRLLRVSLPRGPRPLRGVHGAGTAGAQTCSASCKHRRSVTASGRCTCKARRRSRSIRGTH